MVCYVTHKAWRDWPQQYYLFSPFQSAVLSTLKAIAKHRSPAKARCWYPPGMHWALGFTEPGIQECNSWWYVAWCVISDIPYNSSVLISFLFPFYSNYFEQHQEKITNPPKWVSPPVKPWNACFTWCHFMLLHPKLWPFSPPEKMSSLGVDSCHDWLIIRSESEKLTKSECPLCL